MSRSMLLVFLFVFLIITSQFEWKQQLVPELDIDTTANSLKQQQISTREEAVKEKILLLQERNIQRLNEVVGSLREQLQQCRGGRNITNGTTTTTSLLSGQILELERLHVLED